MNHVNAIVLPCRFAIVHVDSVYQCMSIGVLTHVYVGLL